MSDYFLTPNWPAPENITAVTTLRNAPLALLDLPIETLLLQKLFLQQVHGTNVICADDKYDAPKADAIVAFKPGNICAVRTADCLPIILCDRSGSQVAAIHAGWRGLAAGIITTTCNKLTAPMQQCLAWVGPAIGPERFEVGADVLEKFKAYGWHQEQLNAAFVPQPNNKWLGNLVHLARYALQQQGILAENIYGGEWCTYSDPERFYSYRRSWMDPGRHLTLIWRK